MSDNTETQLKRLPRFKPRSGIAVMYASIRALFLRELQTRFGHYRIGYVWALVEPALNVVFMLILFGAIIKRVLPGIEYPVFLINGILPFFVFRKSAIKALGAIEANAGLLSYRNVKPIDIILARTGLEFLLYFVCYVLLTLVLVWIGFEVSLSHIPYLLFCWLAVLLFSFGLSICLMVIGSWSKEINKVITPFFILMYFMSGAIFPLHRVPEEYLVYFLWNPLAHIFELMRHSVAPTYITVKGVSMSYVWMCVVFVLFLGLALNQVFQERMLTRK
ncbi:capsular polysaccharide transport system permease protein [Acinetobacter marinus]|uniref:Transport permease protein n=1 Tax=Acinetobacter marinus TaxID=281375 RepID=A0A1G6KZC3_9GAMM|nr:ABC transporter permease [Acinetobacter marinus]SDC36469.1 capsular polysaccharide transport system permease protein [Acinetobacter marinus]